MTNIYSYKLLPDGGYEVFHRQKRLVKQIYSPNNLSNPPSLEPLPLSPLASEQLARFIIYKLDSKLMPFVTPEEEIELSSGVVSTQRMMDMIIGT